MKPSLSITALTVLLFLSFRSFAQPGNNAFANATTIITRNTCVAGKSSFAGQTLFSATADGGAITSSCTAGVNSPDVWYKFVAKTQFPLVSISNLGSSFVNNFRLQILSGSAIGSLTEVGCVTLSSGGATSTTCTPTTALTRGTQYYIRVFKTTAAATTGSNAVWAFDICVTDQTASTMKEVFQQTILASGGSALNYPWEITYGPDDSLWITESRGYKLYKMHPVTGAKRTVLDLSPGTTWISSHTPGNPTNLDTLRSQNSSGNTTNFNDAVNGASGGWPQGGFAGLAIHPQYGDGTHNFIYVSYVYKYLNTVASNGGVFYRNKLVRFKYDNATQGFGSPIVLCDTIPGSSDHNSQRLIIAPVGGTNYLFYAAGDMGAGQFGNKSRTNKAQNAASYEGKILRFLLDSAGVNTFIPSDNPFGTTSAVYCTGIRNNQGFAYDASTSNLYGASHGPFSDDEINIIQSGKNYGHPLVIGYAADGNYNTITAGAAPNMNPAAPSSCPTITNEATNAATIGASYKDPLYSGYASSPTVPSIVNLWNTTNGANASWPSEAWSGIDLYSNSIIPGWKGSLVASGLKWGRMIKLKLGPTGATIDSSGSGTRHDTITYFQSVNRYRDAAFGPNGKDIYLVMDNSSATSGPGVGNPVVPGCQGCVIKYTFLGYLDDGTGKSTIDTSVRVTSGTVNTIINGNTITIDNTNKDSLWVPITGTDGKILAEIYPNGNSLGTVTSAFYIHSGPTRTGGGIHYLNRNITITPQNQPGVGQPVGIRLYISKAEFDALDLDPAGNVSAISDLKILKNSDPISSAVGQTTTVITPTASGQFDSQGYYIQGTISSFSSFYFAANNIVLPVDLISFTGSLQSNGSALLKWKTANEVNTADFVVERSLNAVNFTAIGSTAAIGSGNNVTNYTFNDPEASRQNTPVIYYRLRINDNDGAFKYSNIIALALKDITGKVTVAPNPVSTIARVTISAPADGQVQYKVTEITGRTLQQGSLIVKKGVPQVFSIDMSNMPAAVYSLNVTGAGMNTNVKLQKD
ncbi:MAG: PQQ-dependent sugar dehydrogenase [Chitinophagaceae bacterium]